MDEKDHFKTTSSSDQLSPRPPYSWVRFVGVDRPAPADLTRSAIASAAAPDPTRWGIFAASQGVVMEQTEDA